MAVEVIGVPGEANGYGDSMDAFRSSHETNSRIIMNLATGRKKNAPTPPYDPAHPDNAWPTMAYHPEKGEKVIGVSLVGLRGEARRQAEAENKSAAVDAKKAGYRAEPYQKPQIALLDPLAEKAALKAKNEELEGKIVAQGDQISKLSDLVTRLLEKK